MKKNSRGGFTLAELLIVVAIIAILVAIGIPAFSTAMERSREAVDLANMRAAYAEFMAGTLGDDANTGEIAITFKQTKTGWITDTSGLQKLVNDTDNAVFGKPAEGSTAAVVAGPTASTHKAVKFTWVTAEDADSSKPTISILENPTSGVTEGAMVFTKVTS